MTDRYPPDCDDPREPPLLQLAKKIRYDLTALQGKTSELLRQIDVLNLQPPVRYRCASTGCGWDFRTTAELEEHAYHHHNGPLPTTWALADERAQDAA